MMNILRLLGLLFAITCSLAVHAQRADQNIWQSFSDDNPVRLDELLLQDQQRSSVHSWKAISSTRDHLGFTHHKYQQQVLGIPVFGALKNFHENFTGVYLVNGKYIEGSKTAVGQLITTEEAVAYAMEYVGAKEYTWENKSMEADLKRQMKDAHATYYPSAKLMWYDKHYGTDLSTYQLCYQMDVYTSQPEDMHTLFISAYTGAVVDEMEGCHTHSTPATAETRYHGTRQIITDSIAPDSFILYDASRGGGILTLNALETTDIANAVPFVDRDNYWDFANSDPSDSLDNAAADVHWGMEQTYDYFLEEHGRNSFDDKGTEILSYVHYDQNWFNASWNGRYARFGDGNGNPLTSISVVSHELTHGVTGNSSALIYRYESGALNESFSDIFGVLVKFRGLGDTASWNIGTANFELRSMSNPKSFGDPDTYRGDNWEDGAVDNGGVHTNSSVQNYWFYLLSDGGSGTNDKGHSYDVPGMGRAAAAEIAYRMNNVYLTPTSNFHDARNAALQAAKDIYGSCSDEVLLVNATWYAVGVGFEDLGPDLSIKKVLAPENGCSLMDEELLTVQLQYNYPGCDLALPAGTVIPLRVQRSIFVVVDTLVLAEDLEAGATIDYTIQNPVDLSVLGTREFTLEVNYSGDAYRSNNFLELNLQRTHVLDTNYLIDFESPSTLDEYLFINTRDKSDVYYLFDNFGTDNRLRFTAKDFARNELDSASLANFVPFETNLLNIGVSGICVDSVQVDSISLSFVMIQQYADSVYSRFAADEAYKFACNFRVTVNGDAVTSVFQPQAGEFPQFDTIAIDLSDYIGMEFQIGLEGQHFLDEASDFIDHVGDVTDLNGIKLEFFKFSGTNNIIEEKDQFHIEPNLVDERLHLIAPNDADLTKVSIYRMDGVQLIQLDATESRTLDVGHWNAGMYIAVFQSHKGSYSKKWIKR